MSDNQAGREQQHAGKNAQHAKQPDKERRRVFVALQDERHE